MHFDAVADDAGIDDIVFGHSQAYQKQQDKQRGLERSGRQRQKESNYDRDQWTDHGNELQHPSQDSENNAITNADDDQTYGRGNANHETGGELGPNVSRHRPADVEQQAVSPSLQPLSWHERDNLFGEFLAVLQHKEGKDRYQHQPGDVNEITQYPDHAVPH